MVARGYASQLLAVMLMLAATTTLSFARGQTEEWVEHPQPDGASIFLPPAFTIVEVAGEASRSAKANGTFAWSQSLLNVKGTHAGVVCSIRTNRMWIEDAGGNVLSGELKSAEEVIRTYPSLLRREGLAIEVIDQARSFSLGQVSGWRMSVAFNAGASRLDQIAFGEGDVLYTMNASYRIEAQGYWTPVTDAILARWHPSATTQDRAAVTQPRSDEWKRIKLSSGERLVLPPSWVVIEQDDAPERVSEAGHTTAVSKLLNARPNRRPGDTSTVMVFSIQVIDDRTLRPVPLTEGDMADAHEEMAGGVGPAMRAAGSGEPARRRYAGGTAYFTRLTGAPETGIPIEGFLLSFVRGDRVYTVLATYREGESAEIDAVLEEIITRSEFPEAVGTERPNSRGGAVGAAPSPPLATDLDPLLLAISFVLTWGIGLTPPVVIRYILLRRPIRSKAIAGIIAGGLFVSNLAIFTALGSESKTHTALVLVCLVSFYILRRGHARLPNAAHPPDHTNTSNDSCAQGEPGTDGRWAARVRQMREPPGAEE